MAVDTHIFRLVNRTRTARGKGIRAVEERLVSLIPKKILRDAHHWIFLHGHCECKARESDCTNCLISDLREYKGNPRA